MTDIFSVSLDGITLVPNGHVATIKTYLEMSRPALPAPALTPDGCSLHRLGADNAARYREIFGRLGLRWLWWSRLLLSPADLAAIIGDNDVHAFAVQKNGADIGLLELDFRAPEEAELAFLGLFDGHTGKGIGNWLMHEALALAAVQPIQRLVVHTCTFDHPAALGFYRKWGFRPRKQAIEIVPDPRRSGVLPPEAAPHIPVV